MLFLPMKFVSFWGAESVLHIASEFPAITNTNSAGHTESTWWIPTDLSHREAGDITWLN